MSATKRRKKRAGTNVAGRELMAALRQLHREVMQGDGSKLTRRTVEIPEPARYGAKQIKSLRQALGVSQAIFAHLLAVSPELVSSWEYGIRHPAPIACRLLDRIREDPAAYLASLMRRKSAA